MLSLLPSPACPLSHQPPTPRMYLLLFLPGRFPEASQLTLVTLGTTLAWPRCRPLCPDTRCLVPPSMHFVLLRVLPPGSGSLLTCAEMSSLMNYSSDYLPRQAPSFLPASTFAAFYFLSHCLVKSFWSFEVQLKRLPLVKSS